MALVEVEVDLDDVGNFELIEEVTDRIRSYRSKRLSEKQVTVLKSEFSELAERLGFTDCELQIKTLADKMKIEYLASIWQKYTLEQIPIR